MKELRGDLRGQGLRIGIVASRFNEMVTRALLQGAHDALAGHGVGEEDISLCWVPGSFELPLAAKSMAQSGQYDSLVCLGCVIRGETSHYELVAEQAARGIGAASLETGVPISFGVLATDSMEQALNRAGGKMGNKGYDAALAAIEMARLFKSCRGHHP